MKTTAKDIRDNLTDVHMIADLPKGSHIGFLVGLGRAFPKSKHMIRRWKGLSVLGGPDVDRILAVFPEATFKLTKSGRYARLTNFEEFKEAYSKTV